MAEALEELGRLREPAELVRLEGDHELAGRLEIAGDVVVLEVGPQAGEVLAAEPLEHRELLAEAGEAVLDPVREGADHEPAVSAARAEPDGVGLQDDDLARRVVGDRVEGGPEAGEPGADDAEVGLGEALERRLGSARRKRLEPVGARLCIREGGALSRRRGSRGPGEGDAAESTERPFLPASAEESPRRRQRRLRRGPRGRHYARVAARPQRATASPVVLSPTAPSTAGATYPTATSVQVTIAAPPFAGMKKAPGASAPEATSPLVRSYPTATHTLARMPLSPQVSARRARAAARRCRRGRRSRPRASARRPPARLRRCRSRSPSPCRPCR